jgi:hypothetical protein
VTAFAASSSATATIAVTQPRNLQAELDKALADLTAERAAHNATKVQLVSVSAQVATLATDLATAKAALATTQGLTAKEVRKLKWQYNTLVKKYNVGKPRADRIAFVK